MEQDLKVYLLKIDRSIPKNALKEFLNISIVNHCLKYKLEQKQYESLYGFYILRKLYLKLYNIDINNFILEENLFGKPYFNSLYFNISNSMGYLAIAISSKQVGIDIEFLYNFKKDKAFERMILSSKELKEFNKTDDKNLYLLTKWCQKESYFKYIGKGINFPLLKTNIRKEGYFKYFNLNNDLACVYVYTKHKVNEFKVELNYNE